jgi:uncharacterized protein (TIGR02996 family)
MIRRYELDQGNAVTFWEIETRDDVSFVCRWGKRGAAGRNERNYAYADAAAADKAAGKLIAERLKKGFALVGDAAPAERSTKRKPVARAAKTTVSKPKGSDNARLEALLADNPEDAGTWQVYADWLLEQNQPWGEVIALAANGKRPKAQQDAATKEMLRGLDGSSLDWRFGTIDTAILCPEEDDGDDDDDDDDDGNDEETAYAKALRRILKHPAGRLVRHLELGLPPGDDIDWSYQLIIPALTTSGVLPLLQSIDMTADAEFMDQESWRGIGDLRKLWAVAPRLAELHLKGSCGAEKTRLGDIVAPHLETFVHISSGMSRGVPEDIGRAHLPELRHLELYLGQEDYGLSCKLKHFAGIFAGKGLPKLEYLGIVNSEWERDLIAALAKAPIVARLKTLDLSKGTLFREGAAALLEHAAAFRHLDKLDLDDNYLEPEQCKAIETAIPCAHIGDQREVDDWDGDTPYRYVSVGE